MVSLATVVLIAPLSSLQPQQSPVGQIRIPAIDRIFSQWDRSDSPGCAVGVSQNGQVVYERGYGMANLEDGIAIVPGSIFHVASVSKQFTAMVVLLLAREGKLSLDDDIRRYIPELPDYGQRITIRHLLTHTSGLRDQWDLLRLARGRFEEDLITEANVLDIVLRQKSLNFRPGTHFLYSNTGYTLAAVIVKRVTGNSLRAFSARRIFQPLGMSHTHFHDEYTEIVPGRTSAYAPNSQGGWRVSTPHYSVVGATSLFTTVGDMLRWEENFAHPVVGDGSLVQIMQTSAVLQDGDTTGYGMGLLMDNYRGMPRIWHSGSDAGYKAYATRFPNQKLAIAVFCNASNVDPRLLAEQVADHYLGLQPLARDSTSYPIDAAMLASYAGVYVSRASGTIIRLTIRNGKLARVSPMFPHDVPLTPLSNTRFAMGTSNELVFDNPGSAMLLTTWPWHLTDHLVRVASTSPISEKLTQYAGDYYSDELDAAYHVAAADTMLIARTWMATGIRLYPAARDLFDGAAPVEFTRDDSGAIDGMIISTTRAGRIHFVKVRM